MQTFFSTIKSQKTVFIFINIQKMMQKENITISPLIDTISLYSLHNQQIDPGCFTKARVNSIIHFQEQSVYTYL